MLDKIKNNCYNKKTTTLKDVFNRLYNRRAKMNEEMLLQIKELDSILSNIKPKEQK